MSSPLYIITFSMLLNDHRHTGTYELDMDRMTKSMVTDDIKSGQFEDVDRVYECFPGESCTDITDEIATEIRDRLVREGYGDREARLVGWIHEVLGVDAIGWAFATAAE